MAMVSLVYYNKLLEIVETSPELKKTYQGIVKQMGTAAGGAAVGGICGGPPGALVGTIIGALIGYAWSDDYDSLVKVLRNLSREEKRVLEKKVQDLIGSVAIEDLMLFVKTEVNRQMLLTTIQDGVKSMSAG